MRSVLVGIVAIVLVLGLAGTAEARRGVAVITFGTDYWHLRDVPPDKADGQAGWMVGYRYDYWGLFWLDLQRGDGQFILYRDDESFVPITDLEAEKLGASVPWKYHLPVGWIVIAGLIEAAIVAWALSKRRAVLGFAGAMGVLSLVFLLLGLIPELVIPLALAGHHLVVANRMRGVEMVGDDFNLVHAPPPERDFVADVPPRIDDDPVRAPPMAKPIVGEKPPERPSTAPIVHDANAEQPKLLR